MDVTCPACDSGDVEKLSVLWDEITSGNQTSIDRLEAAITAQLDRSSSSRGPSREALRELLTSELAPPQKKPDLPVGGSCLYMALGIAMFFIGFVMVILATIRLASEHLGPSQVIVIVLGGLVLGAVGWTIGQVGFPKPTYREYGERLEAWECTYLCMRCGNHFAIDMEAP